MELEKDFTLTWKEIVTLYNFFTNSEDESLVELDRIISEFENRLKEAINPRQDDFEDFDDDDDNLVIDEEYDNEAEEELIIDEEEVSND